LIRDKIYLKKDKKLNKKRRKPMKKQVKKVSATGRNNPNRANNHGFILL
jgi:hypothetical protein